MDGLPQGLPGGSNEVALSASNAPYVSRLPLSSVSKTYRLNRTKTHDIIIWTTCQLSKTGGVLRKSASLRVRNRNNLLNPKPGHTTGGSGRAAHGGAAGRGGPGRVGRRLVCSRRTHMSLVPSRASKKRLLNVAPEARTSEILCKPLEEQSPRLTTGLSPGREALFVPGC